MKEIVFENICKSYGKTHVVKNLNLTIKKQIFYELNLE